MPLLQDLLTWSRTLAPWAQDALRRVFTKDDLADQDYDELVALLLSAHSAAEENGPKPEPLHGAHLPAIPTAEVCTIRGIAAMKHVNRFPLDSSIIFSPTALTVIYGENGSGKSGVARVLKQVCRARKRDRVLGNAFANDFARQVPSAVINYQVDGRDGQLDWTMGASPPDELRSVAVFDSACSIDYISAEGDASFQPFGLGHLETLANRVFPEMGRRLETALRLLDCDVQRFASLAPADTAAGAIVSNITDATDVAELRRLGTLTEADIARLAELTAALDEANAEPKAQALEGLSTRLGTLRASAFRARAFVLDQAIDKWKGIVEARDEAERYRQQAEALLRGDFLPGTGSETWRKMFVAAMTYSTEEAYRGQEPPYVADGAKCVLCQTDLNEAARARLTAFNDYVIGDAATAAQNAATALKDTLATIEGADLAVPVEEVLQREIEEHAPDIVGILAQARDTYEARRRWMVEQQRDKAWTGVQPLVREPGGLMTIEAAAEVLRRRATILRQSVDEDQRKLLTTEKNELSARTALAPHVDAIMAAIANLKRQKVIKEAKASLDTTAISRHIGKLATQYITDALAEDMVRELKKLGVSRIAHGLRKRVDRGRTMMSLTLNGADAKAAQVLSEGEQRVASLALFFAELHQSGSRFGLIVDDPVSSLDHRYRLRVLTECERKGVQPLVMTMDWFDDAPGHVSSGLPWMQMSVEQRVQSLKEDHAAIAKVWGEHPSEEAQRTMAAIYARMRGTLERLVREVIFNKAIRPFDDRVQIERVAAVAGFSEADVDQLNEVYLRCNPTIDGHDSSGEGVRPMLTPTDLATDITTIDKLIENAKKRRKAQEARDNARKVLRE
jgi:energy-coupling factor transporter ATP-binding protein EcfA2